MTATTAYTGTGPAPTLDAIEAAATLLRAAAPRPKGLRMHPTTIMDLERIAGQREPAQLQEGGLLLVGDIFSGIRIYADSSLQPGQFKVMP